MSAIYFHIPFCRRICAYCDFPRYADLRNVDAVVKAMHAELDETTGFLNDPKIRTLYFGGGTPSLLPPSELERFADHASRLYDMSELEETTVEVNPDDIDDDYVRALRRTTVNRVSVGVQSFDDDVLRWMNRRHTSAQAAAAVKRLQDAGFDNITVDIIFGVAGFGDDLAERNLNLLGQLNVQHVSAYHLTVEPSTRFGVLASRGELPVAGEEQSEREYAMIHERLTSEGFEHYEVSNYARAGRRSKHNSSYWHGVGYLGIGTGAHSYDGRVRRWCSQRPDDYVSCRRYGSEVLTDRDRLNERIMTSLRCAEGLDLNSVGRDFGAGQAERLRREAVRLQGFGVVVEDGRIRIPAERMLLSDAVIESLFEV